MVSLVLVRRAHILGVGTENNRMDDVRGGKLRTL